MVFRVLYVLSADKVFEKGQGIMPRTIRKTLILKVESALNCLDSLDEYIFEMDILHEGRQPAITAMKKTIVEGHEMLRVLWKALRKQL